MDAMREIISAALAAPSGDNCQPWRIAVRGNRIDIFNLPERDTSLFNYRQLASLVAHGALIENILIASSVRGYTAKLIILPDRSNPNLIATLELEEFEARKEPLYPFIPLRSTNRKLYKPMSLNEAQRQSLVDSAKAVGAGEVRLVESEGEKRGVAKVIGLNDRLVFENRHLHSFLFDHIRWSDQEARETGDGLDIKTLELAAPDALAFRLFRHWSLLQALNKLGVSRIVAKNAEKMAQSAAALGVVTVNGTSDADFVTGGRIVQRVWLEATRAGLSFQPMTGIVFLMHRILAGEAGEFSPGHADLIRKAHEKLADLFGLGGETIVMLFRVGLGAPPSVRSLRLPMERAVTQA